MPTIRSTIDWSEFATSNDEWLKLANSEKGRERPLKIEE
jgi:hypothetical protein